MLPNSAGPDAARRFLELLRSRRAASPVCVIKDHGPESIGLLSFPCPGISIALDFPVNDGTQALIDALNEFVIAAGGRVYLAKDAFTRQEHFRAMERRLPEWEAIRRRWDPEKKLRSLQSVRVLGDVVPGSTAEPAADPAATAATRLAATGARSPSSEGSEPIPSPTPRSRTA
jgi:FAD/FMN-containing dehydrogenase